jgi:hypothetical protein
VDRTLISWNVPNMITVPLMAFGGFLGLALIWQVAKRAAPLMGIAGFDDDDNPDN